MNTVDGMTEHDWISKKAYELWCNAGCPCDEEGERLAPVFWSEAEGKFKQRIDHIKAASLTPNKSNTVVPSSVKAVSSTCNNRLLSKASKIIFLNASLSAGASFTILTLIPIPFVDTAALTYLTKTMCDQLATAYGYASMKGISTFFGVVVGAASGVKLATGIISSLPGIGSGANAAATFSLHMVSGFALVLLFELMKSGDISEDFILTTPMGGISILLGFATDVVGDIARGCSPIDSINSAKEMFKQREITRNAAIFKCMQ